MYLPSGVEQNKLWEQKSVAFWVSFVIGAAAADMQLKSTFK